MLALDKIGAEGAGAVLQKTVDLAKAGDARSAEMILSRVWPARRGRPIVLDLPALNTAGGLAQAMGAVVAAVAGGILTPEEGHGVAALLELQRKAIETEDIAVRVATLEQAAQEKRR